MFNGQKQRKKNNNHDDVDDAVQCNSNLAAFLKDHIAPNAL